MHEHNPRTNSAHLDFIPGSATGPGMTLSKLFPFPVPVFPLALPLSALPEPSNALPQPRETELTTSPQKGEQMAAALSIPGSYILQVLTRDPPPLTEPLPLWANPLLIFPVCVQRPEYRNQLPAAPKHCPGENQHLTGALLWGVPSDNSEDGSHSLPLSIGNHCGGEVLQGEHGGVTPVLATNSLPFSTQLPGGSKPAPTPQISPIVVAQRTTTPQSIPIRAQPHQRPITGSSSTSPWLAWRNTNVSHPTPHWQDLSALQGPMGHGQGRQEMMHQILGTASCSQHSSAGLPPCTEGAGGWLGEHGGHCPPILGEEGDGAVWQHPPPQHIQPRDHAGTWDWEWQGKRSAVLNASSAEGIPGPVARACEESQCQSPSKRLSSLGN